MENFDAEQPMEDLQEQTPKKEPKNPLYDCYSLLHDLVYILAAITIVFVFFVRLVGVDGPSMMPTLQDGDYVALLSNLFMGDLEQGDVIVARKESFAKQSKKILYAILPETPYRRTLRAVAEADRIFSGFVRGKLLDSLIIGILCFICCSIFKFPYTPIISVFVGVTNIIPIFGPFLGAIPSAFLILLVSPKQCLYFILFIIALQQFDGNILGPKILGKSTGISSFWVIVAIVVGGGFGGVLGMFLGVPIFACISSLVNWFTNRSLTKKGVTDDAMFDPAPLASPDEKKD